MSAGRNRRAGRWTRGRRPAARGGRSRRSWSRGCRPARPRGWRRWSAVRRGSRTGPAGAAFSQWSITAFCTASDVAPGTATIAISSIALKPSSAAVTAEGADGVHVGGVRVVAVRRRRGDTRHPAPAAAVVEEPVDGVGEHQVAELEIAEGLGERLPAGDQARLVLGGHRVVPVGLAGEQRHRDVVGDRSGEACRARADPGDRLDPGGDELDVDAGGEVLGHGQGSLVHDADRGSRTSGTVVGAAMSTATVTVRWTAARGLLPMACQNSPMPCSRDGCRMLVGSCWPASSPWGVSPRSPVTAAAPGAPGRATGAR